MAARNVGTGFRDHKFSCSEELVISIQQFALQIWIKDLAPPIASSLASNEQTRIDSQCEYFSFPDGLIAAPLPVDTASFASHNYIYMHQLMWTQGGDGDRLWNALSSTSTSGVQSSKVVIGCAASGVGKTHMAYDVGLRHAMTIVVRVVTDTATFSEPFAWMLEQLMPYLRAFDDTSCRPTLSNYVSSYMRLTLLAYLVVTVVALQALPSSADPKHMRELALRLHRNGKGDKLVGRVLMELSSSDDMIAKSPHVLGILYPRTSALRDLEASLATSIAELGLPLMFAVDEAHTLMTMPQAALLSRLVMRRAVSEPDHERSSAISSTITDLSGLHINDAILNIGPGNSASLFASNAALSASAAPLLFQDIPPLSSTGSIGHRASEQHSQRNLFYLLVVVLSEWGSDYLWRAFITGTAFSMKAASSSELVSSLALRTVPIDCAPLHRMSVGDMEHILRHYWHLPSDYIDEKVREALSLFRGRAIHFIDGVWEPFICYVMQHKAFPSRDEWLMMLERSKRRLVERWQGSIDRKLAANTPCHADGSGTLTLIPKLVEAVLMHGGRLSIKDNNSLDIAICEGFLAVSSEQTEVNIQDEPIIYHALTQAMIKEVSSGLVLDKLVRSSQETEVSAKGELLERAVAWHIALKCISAAAEGKDLMLDGLLRSFSGCVAAALPEGLDKWRARITHVVNAEEVTLNGHPFSLFISEDGQVNDSIVIINLPKSMGVDIAFVVTNLEADGAIEGGGATNPCHALVAMQSKNQSSSTVLDVMQTLHPGCQHLSVVGRKQLLGFGAPVDKKAVKELPGRKSWVHLSCHPNPDLTFLTKDWIRVPIIARKVAPKLQKFSNDVVDRDLEDYPECAGWSQAERDAAACSPVVWLSIGDGVSRTQPSRSGRLRWGISGESDALWQLVQTSDINSEIQFLHPRLWIPASVDAASQLLARVKQTSSLTR